MTDEEKRERHLEQMRTWNRENRARVRAAQHRYNERNREQRAQACKDRRESIKTVHHWAARFGL